MTDQKVKREQGGSTKMRTLKERTFSGTTNSKVQPWEIEHRQIAREAAAEGIVLLKNEDHILPLKSGSDIAIYGAGAGRTIKGEQDQGMSMNVNLSPFSRE